MKKILTGLIILIVVISTKAQTAEQAVSNLRVLVQTAKTNFKEDLGEKLNENTTNKLVWYKTKYATLGASSRIIHQLADNKNIYFIKYNIKDDDAYLKMLPVILAFVEEVNFMEESGNYIRRNYKDAQGMDVTEIKDKYRNHILNYFSNKASQNFYIFGMNFIKK